MKNQKQKPIPFMKSNQENNFRLFIVSNQPDFAKGKTTLENLINVSEKIRELMEEQKMKDLRENNPQVYLQQLK